MLNHLYETAWKRVAASATSSHLNSGDWIEVVVIIAITCALSLPVGLNTGAALQVPSVRFTACLHVQGCLGSDQVFPCSLWSAVCSEG